MCICADVVILFPFNEILAVEQWNQRNDEFNAFQHIFKLPSSKTISLYSLSLCRRACFAFYPF